MNRFTHDSMAFIFTLNVRRNTPPKANMEKFTHDVRVSYKGGWFEYTMPIDIFYDDMKNKHP